MAFISPYYIVLVVEQCVRSRHVFFVEKYSSSCSVVILAIMDRYLDWVTVVFLSFVLAFTFTLSEGTSVRNFFFMSSSEADVPGLFLIVRSANMAKYGSQLSSLHFRRVSLMV